METGEYNMSNGDLAEIALKIQNNVARQKVSLIQYQTECSIFKVPKLLSAGMEDAFRPMVVSIGPYHRMDERLKSMEHFKLHFLESFLDLSTGGQGESIPRLSIRVEGGPSRGLPIRVEGESISDLSMELKQKSHLLLMSCVDKILEKEDQIRGSYADPISLSRDDFVQMVLLDSVFIIWSLRELSMFEPSDDVIPSLRYEVVKSVFDRVKLVENEILRDLVLVENQLPLFIIHEIYKILYHGEKDIPFKQVLSEFIGNKLPLNWSSLGNLLVLIRNEYASSFQRDRNEEPKKKHDIMSPTASHLHAAGVKFKLGDGLLQIEFDKHQGVLTISKLPCSNFTYSVFKNIIVLEECMYKYKEPTYITHYFHFLDCLINTKEDVQLLADQGIIPNWMESSVVCDRFNTLSKSTFSSSWNYQYRGLSKELNNHCSKKWNKWMATLKNKYFGHPWAGISVAYAIVLMLLTIAQVVLAILALPGV